MTERSFVLLDIGSAVRSVLTILHRLGLEETMLVSALKLIYMSHCFLSIGYIDV
ncbi:hypothetical protein LINPERHAP2_LOCUS4644 [Linum perenne]